MQAYPEFPGIPWSPFPSREVLVFKFTSMINVKVSGARTRISTFLAGTFLLGLVVGLGDIVGLIPMAALVAVMIMVSVGTMDWHSINPATLRRMPRSETLVMAATVIVTVISHNLAYGVIVGVLTAMVLFARRVAHMVTVHKTEQPQQDPNDAPSATVVYRVSGELFFASSNDLIYQFDYTGDPDRIIIDMTDSHIWDASTVAALDAIVTKYRTKGKHVEIVGLNQDSADRHDRITGNLGAGH
jgi:sulfate permease, SulP family